MFVLLLFADKKSRAASQGSCKVIRAIRVMGKCTHLLSLWLCGHSVLPLCFIIRDNPFNVHPTSQKREKTPESLPPAAWRTQPFVCTVPLRGFFMNYWSQTKECEWREKGRGEGVQGFYFLIIRKHFPIWLLIRAGFYMQMCFNNSFLFTMKTLTSWMQLSSLYSFKKMSTSRSCERPVSLYDWTPFSVLLHL